MVLGRCTQRPYPHFHLSSFNVITRLRSPLTTVPLRQGRRGAKRRRGWIKLRSPLTRSPLIRSPLIRSPLTRSPLTAHSLTAHRSSAHRSPLIRSSAHPLTAHRSSAHRSYILYNKVCLPFCAYLLSFLHPF